MKTYRQIHAQDYEIGYKDYPIGDIIISTKGDLVAAIDGFIEALKSIYKDPNQKNGIVIVDGQLIKWKLNKPKNESTE